VLHLNLTELKSVAANMHMNSSFTLNCVFTVYYRNS